MVTMLHPRINVSTFVRRHGYIFLSFAAFHCFLQIKVSEQFGFMQPV